eukprot:gene2176-2374_t
MRAWIADFLIFSTLPLLCWGKVIAFWHIFTGGTHFKSIVHAQAKAINDSGLYDHLDHIYYTVVGSTHQNVSLSGNKYSLYKNHGRYGNEVQTLKLVYDYCQGHAKQSSSSGAGAGAGSNVKILYFHNKGSFHPTPENRQLRQVLDCFVLSPDCLSVLDDYDTCGMRFTPLPYLHYSGNFWWSTCNHINKLIDPAAGDTSRRRGPLLPTYRPADCMRSSVDKRYITSYYDLPKAASVCPRPFNNRSKSDEKICGLSEFVNNGSYFREGLESTYLRHIRFGKCKDMDIQARTLDWYGQPATLLYQMLALPSNILFRANGWSDLFYSLKGKYYQVPNAEILQALGFQEKDIIEKIPRYHLFVMEKGEILSLSDVK